MIIVHIVNNLIFLPITEPFIRDSKIDGVFEDKKIRQAFTATLIYVFGSLGLVTIALLLFDKNISNFIVSGGKEFLIATALIGLGLRQTYETLLIGNNKEFLARLYVAVSSVMVLVIILSARFLNLLTLEMVFLIYGLTPITLIIFFKPIMVLKSIFPLDFDWPLIQSFFHKLKWTIVASLAVPILRWTDILMVRYFGDISSVGSYALASQFLIILTIIGGQIPGDLTRSFRLHYNRKIDVEKYLNIYRKRVILVWIPVMITVFILSIFFTRNFLQGFEQTTILSLILIPSSLFMMLSVFYQPVLGYQKHFTVLAKSFIGAIVTNIFLNIIFIPLFGIVGAGLSTLFSFIVLFILSRWRFKKASKEFQYLE